MRGITFFSSLHPQVVSQGRALLFIFALSVPLGASATIAQEGAQEGKSSSPRFAPGVLTTIPPHIDRGDTNSTHDIVELRANVKLQREPEIDTRSRTLYEMAAGVSFRREVWCLELAFKPLRMLAVDVPQPSGKMQRKLVWYLVYRVRNTGAGFTPEQQPDGTYVATEKATDEIRFYPQFVLTSQDRGRDGKRVRKSYLDRIMPSAIEAIGRRELPGGKLLSSVEISESVLPVEKGRSVGGLWGVAVWEDVDPQVDFFSVYVGGLSNAYEWQDKPGDFQVGDPLGKGRKFIRKQLQLNFWRPGDAYAEEEREIRFGAATGKADLYGTREGVAFRWIYR